MNILQLNKLQFDGPVEDINVNEEEITFTCDNKQHLRVLSLFDGISTGKFIFLHNI